MKPYPGPAVAGYRGKCNGTISPQLASRLGIKPEHTSRSVGRVADGSFITAYNTVVDYLQVGPKTKQSVEVAVLPMNGPAMGFDGLLGMNFLGDFRYHLNMGNQTIEVGTTLSLF